MKRGQRFVMLMPAAIFHHHHHHHFIRSVAVSNSATQKENLEAEQDTPGADELLQWP